MCIVTLIPACAGMTGLSKCHWARDDFIHLAIIHFRYNPIWKNPWLAEVAIDWLSASTAKSRHVLMGSLNTFIPSSVVVCL